jgi:hypothetical protein
MHDEQYQIAVYAREVKRETHRLLQTPLLAEQELLEAGYAHSRNEWEGHGLPPTTLREAVMHMVLRRMPVPS